MTIDIKAITRRHLFSAYRSQYEIKTMGDDMDGYWFQIIEAGSRVVRDMGFYYETMDYCKFYAEKALRKILKKHMDGKPG